MVYRGSPTPAIVGCFLIAGAKPVTNGATSSATRWVPRVEAKRSPRAYAFDHRLDRHPMGLDRRVAALGGGGWCGDGKLTGQKVAYT